jgi:multiple sugar transport system permease protein
MRELASMSLPGLRKQFTHHPSLITQTMGYKTRLGILRISSFILLTLGAVSMLAPLAWMVSTSLKQPGEVFQVPPKWVPTEQVMIHQGGRYLKASWLDMHGKRTQVVRLLERGRYTIVRVNDKSSQDNGREFKVRRRLLTPVERTKIVWGNYGRAWRAFPVDEAFFGLLNGADGFLVWYINSLIVALSITLGQLVTSSMAAYAFARLKFPGRDKLFLGYLATMMVPGVVTMIPVFILLKYLDAWTGVPWRDTYKALILPGVFSAYGTFMLRQFFMTIPTDLEDAARIDGCTKMGVYRNVILPLSKPALATLATLIFIGSWNDFMWPLIVTDSTGMKTLPVGLASFQGQYNTDWTMLMAASLIVLAPMVLVFLFNQRYFVRGIVMSGLKA